MAKSAKKARAKPTGSKARATFRGAVWPGKMRSTKESRSKERAALRFVIWPDPKAAVRARGISTSISAASGAIIANTTASMHEALKRLADK